MKREKLTKDQTISDLKLTLAWSRARGLQNIWSLNRRTIHKYPISADIFRRECAEEKRMMVRLDQTTHASLREEIRRKAAVLFQNWLVWYLAYEAKESEAA